MALIKLLALATVLLIQVVGVSSSNVGEGVESFKGWLRVMDSKLGSGGSWILARLGVGKI